MTTVFMIVLALMLFIASMNGLTAQKLVSKPNKPSILEIRNCYNVYWSDGIKRLVENVFYYGPAPGVCGGPNWNAAQKVNLVTFATGVPAAGVPGVPSGVTTLYGFQSTVVNPATADGLNAVLSAGALSAGIYARWIDQVSDADQQVGTLAPSLPQTSASIGNGTTSGGGSGALTSRLPLDCHVTIRKYTGVRGHEWSRGRWKFAPVDEGAASPPTYVQGDELTTAGAAIWALLKAKLYTPITDGTYTGTPAAPVYNCLYPILVSTKLSQLRRAPTEIAYANLILPGLNYITGVTNQILNKTLGEQRRRKEHPDVVV